MSLATGTNHGEKQISTTLETLAPNQDNDFDSLTAISRAKVTTLSDVAQLNGKFGCNIKYQVALRPLFYFTRDDETKLGQVQKLKTSAPSR